MLLKKDLKVIYLVHYLKKNTFRKYFLVVAKLSLESFIHHFV